MRSRQFLATTLLAGMLFTMGCSNLPFISQRSAQPTPSPSVPSGSPTAPVAAQPAQESAGNPTQNLPGVSQPTNPSAPVEGGSDTIRIPASQENLAKLESYRVTINWTMNGKMSDGTKVDTRTTYTQALHRPSNTSYTLVIEEKPGTPSNRSEIYSVGDTLYMYQRQDGTEMCSPAMMAGMGNMLRNIIDSMTAPVQVGMAQLVNRGETVNGVLTDHYTLDQETINQFGATVEKADLWVARDGGYLVRYDLTIEVTPNSTGWADSLRGADPMSEGTIVYNWSLEDINKTTVTIPSTCGEQAVGLDLPLPPGTQVDLAIPNTSMGKVNASIDSVMAFFKSEYPKLGYNLTYEYGDPQNGYMLTFQKDSRQVMVQFSTTSDGSVQITLTRN
ncbi:MAG: hypothetical protein SNJ69_00165 [Chloroflexaceae bacterium]